jgi:hypothetical protein
VLAVLLSSTETEPAAAPDQPWVWSERSVTAPGERGGEGVVSWEPLARPHAVDLAVRSGAGRGSRTACDLLDAALAHLARAGVTTVHLTLTAGEPQTPGLLQVARGTRSAAASPAAVEVVHTEVHSAGRSALIEMTVRPGLSYPRRRPVGEGKEI